MPDAQLPNLSSVALRLEGEVGFLGLNRPETLNAFDAAMVADITAAAAWFDGHGGVKVVVVHSTGRAFSSGFHTDQFRSTDPVAVARAVENGRRMIERLEQMRPMTVAAANGHCIGGGMILLIACDLRYVADDVSCLLPETHLGIPLPWGGVPRLVRELGSARAAEIILLDDRMGAERLAALGLVNGVVPVEALLATATATARRLCGLSRLVLETTRAQMREAREQMATTDRARPEETAVRLAMEDAESAAVRLRTMQRRGR